jgi:hypothetical protein
MSSRPQGAGGQRCNAHLDALLDQMDSVTVHGQIVSIAMFFDPP